MNNKTQFVKITLIASLILNLAFISGFVTKKILSQANTEKPSPNYVQHRHMENEGEHVSEYEHLSAKNPEFKKAYNIHREKFVKTANELVNLKGKLLKELKKEQVDNTEFERLLAEINRLTGKLSLGNYRHLRYIKTILAHRDFQAMLDHMIKVLRSDHDSQYHDYEGSNEHQEHSEHKEH